MFRKMCISENMFFYVDQPVPAVHTHSHSHIFGCNQKLFVRFYKWTRGETGPVREQLERIAAYCLQALQATVLNSRVHHTDFEQDESNEQKIPTTLFQNPHQA